MGIVLVKYYRIKKYLQKELKFLALNTQGREFIIQKNSSIMMQISPIDLLQKAKQELFQIMKEQQEDNQFNSVINQIQQTQQETQIFTLLKEFMKKKTAQDLAKKFYDGYEKKGKVISKTQQFFNELRKKQMPGEDINMVRNYFEKGKRNKIKQFLCQKFGQYEGSQIFDRYQTEFKAIESKPLPNSKKLKLLNGLQIYQYPSNYLNDIQKKLAKTLIVLGETGCGKSTFLNSLANYLAGVQVQDPFRYFIVVENTQSQLQSITSQISIYYLKDTRTGTCYRVIDTPGFGDTNGINKDKEIVKKIQKLFRTQIEEIHLVLFLVKSSNTRVTQFLHYVFQNVMDLFDKSIAENFVFVLTFADASQPVVLQSIKDKRQGFGQYWNQIKQPKTIQVNNSGFFHKAKQSSDLTEKFWKIGVQFIQKLIVKAQNIKPKSLSMTKQLIRKKQNLAIRIKSTADKIQNHLIEQQNMKSQITQMVQNEQNIKNNANFQYLVDQLQWYGQKVKANVTRCNNCMNSNCHDDCCYGDGQQKKNCASMDNNGYCTVCPRKCHYSVHTNDHIIRKTRNVKITETNQGLKRKYNDAKSKQFSFQKILEKMVKEYQKSLEDTKQNIKYMTTLQKELQQISMSKTKPLSTKEYINLLIEMEQRNRKDGYTMRIKNYRATLHQLEVQQQTIRGQTLQNIEARRRDIFKNLTADEKVKKSSIFSRLKTFFGID